MAEMSLQWLETLLCSSSLQPITRTRTNETELDDMAYPCPFCSKDFNIGALCSHLEDDHCIQPQAMSYPVRVAKVEKDVVGHIHLQHGQLFKMQRQGRSQNARTSSNRSLAASEGVFPNSSSTLCQDKSRLEAFLTPDEEEDSLEVEALRVKFVQELLYSIIFNDC